MRRGGAWSIDVTAGVDMVAAIEDESCVDFRRLGKGECGDVVLMGSSCGGGVLMFVFGGLRKNSFES